MTLVCPFCRIALNAPDSICPRDGHAAQPVDWLSVPAALTKRFRVLAPFAHGETGSLYLADESESGRRGLLKILTSVAKHREPERARLRRELAKQVTLPAGRLLVPWASGESEGVTWLFRPWLDGVSLRVRLAQGGKLPLDEALSLSAQLAGGLDELHRSGLLHRDIKPGHVFLQTNGQSASKALLIDPGLCGAVVRPGNSTVLGTPGYVAPEQLQGKLVSFRSDLYSLGCVMYEMLAGHPPFGGETEQAVLAAQLSGEPAALPPEVPEGIVAVLRSLLAKEPQERPFSAQKLRRILEPYAPDGTPMTRPPTTTFGTLPDPEKPGTKPGGGPSLPPPPPSEALRASKPPAAKAPSLPPPRITARPTTRGLAPPPPPPAAEETQQIDLEQFEVLAEEKTSADQTQELSPEHLIDVRPQPAPARPPAATVREDHTLPIRLDQVLAIAPAKLRASAAPPPLHEPEPAQPQHVEPEPAASAPAPAPAERQHPITPAVDSQPSMFVEDEHETLPFPGHEGAVGLPAPASALFGALPEQPAPASAFAAALEQEDESSDDAEKTAVAHKPLAPSNVGMPASFAAIYAGDEDPTTALPAPSGLSPNTIDDNGEEAALASRHLQDTLRPFLGGGDLRRKLMLGAAAAALLGLGVLTVKALIGGDEDKLAARDLSNSSTGAVPAPPPPPSVEPAAATALAAAPKNEPQAIAQPEPQAEPAPQVAPAEMPSAAALPSPTVTPAPSVEPVPTASPVEPATKEEPAGASRLSREDKRRLKREEKAREAAEKAARAAAEKQAKADKQSKQSKQSKKSGAANDRTAKWTAAVDEARAHYAAKRYKQAAQAYERAAMIDPTSDRTFSGLGTARFKSGDFKGAAAAYQRAIQLSPSNSVYHTSLARTYQQMGDPAKAKASYKRALALDPKNEGAKKSLKELGG